MRVVYVHGFAGVSGRGLLGALLAAGAPLAAVQEGWRRLQLPPVEIVVDRVPLPGYTATRLTYSAPQIEAFLAPHTLATLLALLEQSEVLYGVRQQLVQLVGRFADAIAPLHGPQGNDYALRSAFMPAVLYMGSGVILALEALARGPAAIGACQSWGRAAAVSGRTPAWRLGIWGQWAWESHHRHRCCHPRLPKHFFWAITSHNHHRNWLWRARRGN